MQHDPRWRHKNRVCKRNLKSIYFDREDETLKQATACPSYPAVRKRRYVFVGQFAMVPRITNIKVLSALQEAGVKIKEAKKWLF